MTQAQIKELADDIRENPDKWLKAMEDNQERAKTMLYYLGLAMPIIAKTMATMENAEVFDSLTFTVDDLMEIQAKKILEQAENDRMQEMVEHRDSYSEMVKREIFK